MLEVCSRCSSKAKEGEAQKIHNKNKNKMETLKLARTRNEQKQILKLIHIQKYGDTHIHTNTNTENLYKSIYIIDIG